MLGKFEIFRLSLESAACSALLTGERTRLLRHRRGERARRTRMDHDRCDGRRGSCDFIPR